MLTAQIAALVAEACAPQPQHVGSNSIANHRPLGTTHDSISAAMGHTSVSGHGTADGASGDAAVFYDDEDDVPLALRRQSHAAAGTSTRSSKPPGQNGTAKSAAADALKQTPLAATASSSPSAHWTAPPAFLRGRPVLYVTAEESKEQVSKIMGISYI